MAASAAISFRPRVLAWAGVPEDDKRFRRILHVVLGVVALICLFLLLMPAPEPDRAQPVELPPRLAKLMIEQRETPPAPKPKAPDVPAAKEQPEARPGTPEPVRPEPAKKAAPVPEARQPLPNRPPGEVEGARRRAAGVGLLAMKDQLAELRGAPTAVQLNPNIKQGPGVGSGVGVGVGAGTDAGVPDRAMITSNATGGSGGINTAGYSRNTGGGGLAGRATTLVEGVAGGGGGGGAGGGGRGGTGAGSGQGGGGGGTMQRAAGGKASRSIEDVRLVFERNKGAIYAIYNRALRDDPTLQGKVVFKLTISPSGEVTDLRIEASELKNSDLERKLLARIRQFDFGAKQVETLIATYPVDFLPS